MGDAKQIYAEKQDRAVSPKGEAQWAFLTEPQTKWKPEGEYKVNLVMDKGKASAGFIAALEAVRDEYYDTLAEKLPKAKASKLSKREVFEDEYDEADEETGRIIFKFSSVAGGISRKTGKPWSFTPRLYDSKATLIKAKIMIGNGSILQVNYTPSAYRLNTDSSVGCKMYVNDVMIHKLVEIGGGDPGFEASDDADGFSYAGADAGFTAPEAGDDDNPAADGNTNF